MSVQCPANASSIELSTTSVNQVVQTFFSDVADIHGRTLPDRFQTFEDLDVGGGILLFLLLYLFSFSTHIDLKYIVQIYGKVS